MALRQGCHDRSLALLSPLGISGSTSECQSIVLCVLRAFVVSFFLLPVVVDVVDCEFLVIGLSFELIVDIFKESDVKVLPAGLHLDPCQTGLPLREL